MNQKNNSISEMKLHMQPVSDSGIRADREYSSVPDCSYFFKENDSYVNAATAEDVKIAKRKAAKKITGAALLTMKVPPRPLVDERVPYPSPSGMSPFELSEGFVENRRDPNDIPLIGYDADMQAEYEEEERIREQQRPNHPHLR